MNPYQQKKRWKYSLLTFAVVIASGSLLYTSYLARNIARSERTRAEVWALSMKHLLIADDDDFLGYVISVRDSLSVPAIVTNNKGDVQLPAASTQPKPLLSWKLKTARLKNTTRSILSRSLLTCRDSTPQ